MWMENAVSTESLQSSRQPENRLIIKSGGRVIFVPIDEIAWIEAQANYVRLHRTGRESHLFRRPISRIAEQLDNSRFIRIHRSYIVNISRIRELQPCNSGEFIVSLCEGKELPCSRTYRRALQALFVCQ
jgi:two-component system, LytTR family, response regulator